MNQEYIDKLRAKFAPHEPFIPKSVFIGIPCHDGYICSQFMVSLMQVMDTLKQLEIGAEIAIEHAGGICLSRNDLTFRFMKSHADCLFFLDCDLTFSVDAFLAVLTSPPDIAAGIYPTKSLDLEKIRTEEDPAKAMGYPVNTSANQRKGGYEICEIKGFIRAEEAPTGFMRIKRNVIGKMSHDNPNLLYFNELDNPKYALFNNTMAYDAGERCRPIFRGEDYSFCRLAEKSGFKAYAGLNLDFGHCGMYEYRGNFGKTLRYASGPNGGASTYDDGLPPSSKG